MMPTGQPATGPTGQSASWNARGSEEKKWRKGLEMRAGHPEAFAAVREGAGCRLGGWRSSRVRLGAEQGARKEPCWELGARNETGWEWRGRKDAGWTLAGKAQWRADVGARAGSWALGPPVDPEAGATARQKSQAQPHPPQLKQGHPSRKAHPTTDVNDAFGGGSREAVLRRGWNTDR